MNRPAEPEPSEEEVDRILARLAESPLPEEALFALPGGVTVASVQAAMKESEEEKKSWTHTLLVLGASLLLFTSLGLLNSPLLNLLILVAVLLIHESGHYLGMRLFDYKNVQMYFIPFFGAAVTGKNEHVAGWKVAVVALLGPLPGLLLGYAAGLYFFRRPDPWIGQLATTLLLINGFNLLPFFPLDGGRFLNEVLFSRSRHLELIFRIVTGGLLAYLGYSIGSPILIVVGAMVVLFSGHTFKISTLAKEARERANEDGLEPGDPSVAAITPAMLLGIRRTFPFVQTPKDYAMQAKNVVEKLHSNAPSLASTLSLLGLYFVAIASMVVCAAVYIHLTFNAWTVEMEKGHEAILAAQFAEAEQHYRSANETSLHFGEKDIRRSESLFALASACRLQSKFAEAEPLYRDALKAYEGLPHPDHASIAATLEGLAETLRALKRPEEANPLETRAKEIRKVTK